MMTYHKETKEKVKIHGEVFTPPGVVFQMILQPRLREDLKNPEKTFFDPCVGEGQFSTVELVLKMFYNVDKLNSENILTILNSIRGMDIQEESVLKCKEHMKKTLNDAYKFFTNENFTENKFAEFIINKNFKHGDSLKFLENVKALQKKSESLF